MLSVMWKFDVLLSNFLWRTENSVLVPSRIFIPNPPFF